MADQWDVIIIGGGCTGLASAVYCGRFLLKTLVLGEVLGGTIITTDTVENYPGFIRLTGMELAKKIEDHAREYKSVEIREEKVISIKKEKNLFKVKSEEQEYEGKAVIIATGTEHRKLNVKGEKELANKGVHYCAMCDGAIYQGKNMAVIGGSDSAAKEALLLTQWAKKVYIIYRGELIRPEPVNYERVVANKKIEVITKTNVLSINGKNAVETLALDSPYKGSKDFKIDAVFIAIGQIPVVGFASGLGLRTNEDGEIIIDADAKTNLPGVFAAGDVVSSSFKQAITGVAEGVKAAYSAYQYVKSAQIHPTGNSTKK